MPKKKFNPFDNVVLTEEFFELRLVCDCDTIDIFSLIKYLSQANGMIQGINESLNRDFSCGYEEIEVEAFALEHGSIRIPFKLKKYAIKGLMGIATTFIGGVAVNLVSGNKEPIIIINNDDEEITADPSTFLDNRVTKRNVGRIARMVAEDDGISDLAVTYEKPNGDRQTMTISKETLQKVADECQDTEEDITNVYPKAHLQIYGPILDSKPSSWRVMHNGHKIYAFMTDKDFLEEMTAKKIAFAPNDEIVADLEEIISEDDKGHHSKWYIRKVHNYPKYTRIIKNQPPSLL